MTKILLVRHGHVEGIEPPRFRGRQDLALTELGCRQADAAARHIAARWRPTQIYTSPLARCVATGAAIAAACRLKPQLLDQLNDLDYGSWQFLTYDEARKRDPELFARWFAAPELVRFPDGESLQDLVTRAAEAVRLVLARHAKDTVVLVSHDNLNRALLLQLLDQPLSAYWRIEQSPCCINEIDVTDDSIVVRAINHTAHLPLEP
jgi:broad specificity phosphatase PhoE